MKKAFCLVLVFILLFAGCSSGEEYNVNYVDGSGTATMTRDEMANVYKNDGRTFDAKLKGAEVYGTGKITDIWYDGETAWYGGKQAVEWEYTIIINNEIYIAYRTKNMNVDLYSGDIVNFSGKCETYFETTNYVKISSYDGDISIK